ncbi:MAG: pyrrolo-quinoline quinone [Planctomycetes bacterium]|nr:pyrrolo-quinoline quinone [Planctomycetota bacterium]
MPKTTRPCVWLAALALMLAAVAAALLWAPAAAPAADQPQWGRRFTRNMVSEEKGLPESFDPATGRNIKWKVRLGTETHSSPIVAGGRAFIGTNNNVPRDPRHQGDRGVLMCLDEKDGRLVWQLVVPKLGGDPYLDWPGAGICSPPTVEGDRVYCVSNRGEVMCLDIRGMADGNGGPYKDEGAHMAPRGSRPMEPGPLDADILWLYDLVSGVGIRQHDSAHSSVLLHGQFLYVNTSNGLNSKHQGVERPEAPSLVVLDKATGRLVAHDDERIGPRIFHSTWSSPALGEIGGRPVVFFGGGDGVCYGFEALGAVPPEGQVARLKRVWRFDGDPSAPKEDVHRFITNRRESPSNIKSMLVFHEGRIYVTLGGDIWWGKNEAWLKCADAARPGDVTASGQRWSYPVNRHCVSTPSVHEGLAFVADCGRTVHCVDADTGSPCWTHDTGGEMWGSTLVADGKVYVGTRKGELCVFAAAKEKRVLATVPLGSPMNATPTAANGVLYIATMQHLYAVQQGAGAAGPEEKP